MMPATCSGEPSLSQNGHRMMRIVALNRRNGDSETLETLRDRIALTTPSFLAPLAQWWDCCFYAVLVGEPEPNVSAGASRRVSLVTKRNANGAKNPFYESSALT